MRSRTYDYLLKGMIFCHECGHPLGVVNRKNASGEDVLYFVCRTYQRFTKAGACTSHCIKEKAVTDAVLAKVKEICAAYLNPNFLVATAKKELEDAQNRERRETDILMLQGKIERLTANLDQLYMDRLSGLLTEKDFERMYLRIKHERDDLQGQIIVLQQKSDAPMDTEKIARELIERFVHSTDINRELMVSLIERVELTAQKEIIIRFRFRALEDAA